MRTDTAEQAGPQLDVSIRPIAEPDLETADRIFRLAFGTFMGVPDPATFMGDADYVRTRWRADPSAAFGAYVDDALVGSNFATHWGSVGFFGPLTIRPDLWDRGVGKRLMEPVIESFKRRAIRHAGLFTFAQSQKHIGLYQRFGFWPRFLTAIMSKPVSRTVLDRSQWTKFSDVPSDKRPQMFAACREVTDAIYGGLDVSSEIRSVADQRLGDTVLLWRDEQLTGLAVCHSGAGSEAGSGRCYVKFGAVRPRPSARDDFDLLLTACEQLAADTGVLRLVAGVNTARHEAYARMLERGFRNDVQGVAMEWPSEEGYNRRGIYLLDDWR